MSDNRRSMLQVYIEILNDELIKDVRHEFDVNSTGFNYDPKMKAQSVPGFARLHNLPPDLSAILVQLFYLIPFRFFVLTHQIDNEWLNELQILLPELTATRERHVGAQALRDVLRVNFHEQQGPCDFLNDFLNRLPEWASPIFKGRKHYTVDGVSDLPDEFFSISLDLHSQLKTFFDLFVRGEDEGNARLCTRIDKSPSVLAVQLKRFEYDRLNETQRRLTD
jgi:hypothetical protein